MRHGYVFVAGGFRPAVTKEGPKWTQVVYLDGSRVRVKRVKGKLEHRPVAGYTTIKLARKFLKPRNCLGVKMSVSKTARKLLKECLP